MVYGIVLAHAPRNGPVDLATFWLYCFACTRLHMCVLSRGLFWRGGVNNVLLSVSMKYCASCLCPWSNVLVVSCGVVERAITSYCLLHVGILLSLVLLIHLPATLRYRLIDARHKNFCILHATLRCFLLYFSYNFQLRWDITSNLESWQRTIAMIEKHMVQSQWS